MMEFETKTSQSFYEENNGFFLFFSAVGFARYFDVKSAPDINNKTQLEPKTQFGISCKNESLYFVRLLLHRMAKLNWCLSWSYNKILKLLKH